MYRIEKQVLSDSNSTTADNYQCSYHIITYFAGLADGDINMADKLLGPCLEAYPKVKQSDIEGFTDYLVCLTKYLSFFLSNCSSKSIKSTLVSMDTTD